MYSILYNIYLNFDLHSFKQYKILNFLQEYHMSEIIVKNISTPWIRAVQIILFGGQMGGLWGKGGLRSISMKFILLQSF
jgi:hypothetical protein